MPPEAKEWKDLQRQGGRGGKAYIPKSELNRLEEETDLDLDEGIEYSVSSGVSDGRPRVFIGLRPAQDD